MVAYHFQQLNTTRPLLHPLSEIGKDNIRTWAHNIFNFLCTRTQDLETMIPTTVLVRNTGGGVSTAKLRNW